MTTDDVIDLKALLQRMRAEDPAFRVFGSERHKYQLGPTLTEPELVAFEQRYGISLPSNYRLFLKEVGDGGPTRSRAQVLACNAGAGPGCGIQPLEEAVRGCDPSQPFPLIDSSIALSVEGIDNWGDAEPYPGVLEISYMGSADFAYLVVNGSAYGTIWEGTDAGRLIFYPTGLSFDTWYRRWIVKLTDKAIPMLNHEHVVERASVGMTKSEITGICGGPWTQQAFGDGHWFLRFEHLATQFELDADEIVTRIVRHGM